MLGTSFKEFGLTSFPELVKMMEETLLYLEKSSMSNLGDFTEYGKSVNAGYGNYTLYWKYYQELGMGNYQGEPYCAGYLSVMFASAFGKEKAKNLLGGSLFISCYYGELGFNRLGRIYSKPEVGDIVFFWTSSLNRYGHVGLVVGVDSAGYDTIEANTSAGTNVVERNGGATCRKRYTFAANKTAVFGRPDYIGNGISMEEIVHEDIPIGTGRNGMRVTANVNLRSTPGMTGSITKVIYENISVYPTHKRFVEGVPWIKVTFDGTEGWISAKYVEGWMQEFTVDNRWWWVLEGYNYYKSQIVVIDNAAYYFDQTGYMFVGDLLISTNESGVLTYVNQAEAELKNEEK